MGLGQRKTFGGKAGAGSKKGAGNSTKAFAPNYLPNTDGQYLIRLFPELDADGQPVLFQQFELDKRGNEIPVVDDDGNPVMRPEPIDVAQYWQAFIMVNVDGNQKKMPIIVNRPFDEETGEWLPWEDPYSLGQFEQFPKKDDWQKRNLPTNMFAVNVFVKSPVLYDADNNPVFAGLDGKFVDKDGKQLTGKPAPYNKVLILRGTSGAPGGKSVFASLTSFVDTIDDEDNPGVPKKLHEVDFKFIIKPDPSGKTWNGNPVRLRFFQATANFKPLTQEQLTANRWSMDWTNAWPHEAVQAVLDGEDYNEVRKEYNIVSFPRAVTWDGTPIASEEDEGEDLD